MSITILNESLHNHSSEPTLYEWNNRIASELILADIFLAMYIVFGVLGNVLIVFVYQYRLQKKKIEDRFFIVALAVLDIIVCVTSSVVYLIFNILPVRFFANWTCKISWFLTRTVSNTSGLLLVLIAVQRYFKVCRPFGWQMTLPRQKVALGLLMIFSIIIDIPLFIFYGPTAIRNPEWHLIGSRCGRLENLTESLSLGLNIYYLGMFATACITILFIVILYILIGRKIFKQSKKRQAMIRSSSFKRTVFETQKTQQSSIEAEGEEDSYAESKGEVTSTALSKEATEAALRPRNKKRKRKSTFVLYKYSLMFMCISAVTALTYIPSLVVNLAVNIDSDWFWTQVNVGVRLVCILVFQVYIFNHVCNPIVYGFFDTSFRKETKKLFCRHKGKP